MFWIWGIIKKFYGKNYVDIYFLEFCFFGNISYIDRGEGLYRLRRFVFYSSVC